MPRYTGAKPHTEIPPGVAAMATAAAIAGRFVDVRSLK
jgi:homoaconitase/3-isopropylmalate dehydratase large subunit